MVKRVSQEEDGAAAYRKRQRMVHETPTSEEVTSSQHLRSLLSFDQDLRNARHGLQSFKSFLDQLNSDKENREWYLEVIREYLEATKPRDTSEEGVYLSDIMEMWSFAVQTNNDGVMSSVAVVLALLLQVISGSLNLVPYGLGICQTLLQERQLKSLSKNLGAEKSKAFIISPTLRLLREAVSLDGGAYAKRIFRARNHTLAFLGRNLEIGQFGDKPEEQGKATVRSNSIRVFLTFLKYLHADGRKELLMQKDLLSHLTFGLKTDPSYIVLEVLESFKSFVLMDDKLPRETKSRSFNARTLIRLLALYTYTADTGADIESSVSHKVHQFLIYACTNPAAGVIYPSTGLYPKETDDDLPGKGSRSLGDEFADKYKDDIPVYNYTLAEVAQKLRPWSNIKHSELLVAIFKAAPELTAKYFLANKSFTFEPKITMTWIGYAAFLFNTMTNPLPPRFGDKTRCAKRPPPVSILLDNIIPLPINQKVLTRCLSSNSHLTSFFATRILIVALEKLAAGLKMLEEASQPKNKAWADATRKLMDAFCQRIPDMKEVVRLYKGIPSENILHRTMASRLIRLYYEVIPRVALAANFDVSPFFVEVLKKLNQGEEKPQDTALGVIELENLVSIASYSPGMRWFSKIDKIINGKACSPFVALLRLLCSSKGDLPFQQLKKVLSEVAIENQLVSTAIMLEPLHHALQGTLATEDGAEGEKVWAFVDNCVNRCAASPIKYLDLMETYRQDGDMSSSDGGVALINVAFIEQLPFATKSASPDELKLLAKFLSNYFNASYTLKGGKAFTKILYKRASKEFSKPIKMPSLQKLADVAALEDAEETPDADDETKPSNRQQVSPEQLEEMLHAPLSPDLDNTALTKWLSKNVEDLVEDTWTARVINLLTSPHASIRKEALTALLKMAAAFQSSSYEEKDQLWLLLSELAESARPLVDAGPVPPALTSFAIHALPVLTNPLHPLYPKLNAFLTRSPVWAADKLPLAHDIFHGAPAEDDRYYAELTWLLAYLLDALASPAALAVFHRKRWFEQVLTLAANPYLRFNLRTRLLHVVYRATCLEGGSTTLVTRFGVLSWLDAQRTGCEVPDEAEVYAAMMRRVWETCDQEKVRAWSRGGVDALMAKVEMA